jgi:hypothetical protein
LSKPSPSFPADKGFGYASVPYVQAAFTEAYDRPEHQSDRRFPHGAVLRLACGDPHLAAVVAQVMKQSGAQGVQANPKLVNLLLARELGG